MKKICLVWMMVLLLSPANLRTAAGDTGLYEGESRTVPSLKSQESPDMRLFRQSDGHIAVSVLSDEFPDIVLHVTVSDSGGNPVSGLTAADFALTEQSQTETTPVSQFLTCFEEGGESTRISFALVFDISGSMERENRLPDAKTAAVGFLNSAQPGDRASLVTFSGCSEGGIVIPVSEVAKDSNQNGVTDIAEAVQTLTVIDRTAVYDGIATGLDSIRQEPFPKGVIVFTDGDSNDDCHYSVNTVIQKAKNLGIPVYTIGLQSVFTSQLRLVAEETGGYYREAPTFADMGNIYADIAQSIRGQYTLCYTTHNPALDGTDRTVTVLEGNSRGSGLYTVAGTPDANPPVILHTPVTQRLENQAVPLTAQVTDPDDSITQVTLFFRLPGSDSDASYTQIAMTNTGPDTYAGEIPAGSAVVEYYITGCNSRQICVSSGSASAPHQISVVGIPPETHPPVITHTPIAQWQENQAIPITAQVTDPDAGDNVDRVILFHRIPGADAYTSVNMTNTGTNVYTATIPASQVTTAGLEYYIRAWDTQHSYAESGSAAAPYQIDVTAGPQPPVASAGPDQSVNELDSVSLDGSGSASLTSDGQLAYSWRQISGTDVALFNSGAVRPVFTAPPVGPEGAVLVFELRVTDSAERSSADTVTVIVNDALAPEAGFTWTPQSPTAGDAVRFTDQSASKGAAIVSWAWDFGGAGNSTAQNPVFTFAESGTYSVRLTVRDGSGSAGTVIKGITVSEPPCAGGDCGGGSGGCFIGSAGTAFLPE